MRDKPDRLEKQQITFSDNEQQSILSVLLFSAYSGCTLQQHVLYTSIPHNGNKRQDHLIL